MAIQAEGRGFPQLCRCGPCAPCSSNKINRKVSGRQSGEGCEEEGKEGCGEGGVELPLGSVGLVLVDAGHERVVNFVVVGLAGEYQLDCVFNERVFLLGMERNFDAFAGSNDLACI
jgi:hypothetical protein